MKQNNIEDIYELSPMQQGMLFHKLAAPNSVVYFEQVYFTLQTQLDVSAFQKAWQQVVDRHPILRTSFYWDNLDKPYQVVYQQVDLPWEFQDWRQLSLQEQQKQLKAFLKADGDRGFELSQAPLIRITLIQVADDTYEFVFSFHHILMETWSINWLWKEFYEFYQAFCQGKDLYLERPRPYREYIAWLQQQDLHKAEAYWRQKLKGFTVPTPIGVGNISTSNSYQEEEYDRQQIQVSASLTAALKSFARKHQLTLNIVLKGAWALLLRHYSGESDVVFGATSSGRPAELQEAESMVGLFINTLPLRVQVDSNAFLAPWLKKLQAEEVEMREYEYSPLLKIQQWSEIPRGLQLFDSILDFENELVDYNQGALAQSIGIPNSQLLDESQSLFDWTNYPLSVNVAAKSDLLNLSISYDTRRFDNATISRMLGHLKTLLEGVVTNLETKLRELPILTSKESYQILRKWNDTKVEYPQQQCIHELFEAQVEKTPDAIAVVFENQQLSYRELNARANQLAHYLQKLGVKPEVLVGICVERSLSMSIAILGILKAGAAYIPIDVNYPKERIEYILKDAQVEILLTQQHLEVELPKHQASLLFLEHNWSEIAQQSTQNCHTQVTSENLAYVIYTSGSTGKPKGVAVNHQALVNYTLEIAEQFKLQKSDRFLQFASIGFDVVVEELFPTWIKGATVVLLENKELISCREFQQLINKQQLTIFELPTAYWHQWVSELASSQDKVPSCVRFAIVGGERISAERLRQWQQWQTPLVHVYGLTETTVTSTLYHLNSEIETLDTDKQLSIGRPIANTQIYLLNPYLQPVPVGVVGEIYIGGAGIARGYVNRAELTALRFIPNPFSTKPGSRLYKTGDLARYLENGEIEYIGRIDYQIKLRGFRIELGEIEAVLNQHPEVATGIVMLREDNPDNQYLTAYIVPQQSNLNSFSGPNTQQKDEMFKQTPFYEKLFDQENVVIEQNNYLKILNKSLRDYLKKHLPDYMIPSAFVELRTLPLTSNGKIDRKALPAPDNIRPQLEAVYQLPQTEIEKTIADIWQEALHIENVGINDNFFELGGHSLLLVQVHSKLQKIFQKDLLLVEMFQLPTVSHLVRYFSQESREETSFIQHFHRSESRTASTQRRKQARKEHRAATKERES